ncbi:MAG: PDZ domain-containing protein [Magnetococcales bacterium]|nr:PDZ domain-containing protein [Magnetococcales bacterium]
MHPNRMIVSLVLVCFLIPGLSRTGLAAGWIGMTIEPPRGVRVGEIIKQGPADKAGLQRGDVIRKMDGQEILSMEQFIHNIRSRNPGTVLTLTVLRNGQDMEIKATLEDGWEHQSVAQTPLSHLRPDPGSQSSWPEFANPLPPLVDWNPAYPQLFQDHATQSTPPATWLGIAPTMAQGGVGVMAVAPNGPGDKSGLKPGDVIVAINNQALATPQALIRLLGTFKPGDVIEINFNRAGQAQTIQAKLEAPPSPPTANTAPSAPPAPTTPGGS